MGSIKGMGRNQPGTSARSDDGDPSTTMSGVSTPNGTPAGKLWIHIHSASSPSTSLDLTPGVYWLAWQIDSNANVPGYIPGQPGDGFRLWHDFGSFPIAISPDDAESTTETWSAYLTFTPAVPIPSGLLVE